MGMKVAGYVIRRPLRAVLVEGLIDALRVRQAQSAPRHDGLLCPGNSPIDNFAGISRLLPAPALHSEFVPTPCGPSLFASFLFSVLAPHPWSRFGAAPAVNFSFERNRRGWIFKGLLDVRRSAHPVAALCAAMGEL